MTATHEPLRPLTLGEILDRTALLYRRNLLLFAGVAAVPTGVLVALAMVLGAAIAFVGVTAKGTISPSILTILLVLAVVLVGVPVGIAATVFSQAGLTRTAVSAHMGERLTVCAALKGARPRFWRYLWLLVLQLILAGLVPAVAAGVVVGGLIYITALVLFYYDQRIRTEGYDIELMMEQAGLTSVRALPGADRAAAASESLMVPDTVKAS